MPFGALRTLRRTSIILIPQAYTMGGARAGQVAQNVENPNNWTDIAEEMRGALGGRNGKSCRLRWCNQLDPRLRKGAFTDWEDAVVVKAHEARSRCPA